METVASTLLITFLVAFFLMAVAVYCVFVIYRISAKAFLVVYENDKDLYFQILDGLESSWIERRTHSIRDFSIWWSLYRTLYRGGRIEEIVGQRTRIKFIRYVRLLWVSFTIAILIAVIDVSIGFILVNGIQ